MTLFHAAHRLARQLCMRLRMRCAITRRSLMLRVLTGALSISLILWVTCMRLAWLPFPK